MNNKVIENLVELGIYNSKTLTKKEYDELSNNNADKTLIYISGYYEGVNKESSRWFKEVNTNNMTIDDIKLQLEINRTKNIKAVKNMVTFFVAFAVITSIITFLTTFQ